MDMDLLEVALRRQLRAMETNREEEAYYARRQNILRKQALLYYFSLWNGREGEVWNGMVTDDAELGALNRGRDGGARARGSAIKGAFGAGTPGAPEQGRI